MRQQIFETALQKVLGEIVACDVRIETETAVGKHRALQATIYATALRRIETLVEEALKRP